jgi:hypothetical protein
MKRVAAALVLFGIAFGYVEAAVVVYLRAFYEPLRAQYYPDAPTGDLVPLLRAEQVRAAGPKYARMLGVELARELATLAMLAGIGLVLGRNAGQWLAGFAVAFGIWDISFYGFLKLLLDWPASVFTWDVLFLIPVPWVGPVLAPVVVSLTMIGAGFVFLDREYRGRPVRAGWMHWLGVAAGGVIIVLSFTLDSRALLAGGMPAPYRWWMLAAGEVLGVGTLMEALRR